MTLCGSCRRCRGNWRGCRFISSPVQKWCRPAKLTSSSSNTRRVFFLIMPHTPGASPISTRRVSSLLGLLLLAKKYVVTEAEEGKIANAHASLMHHELSTAQRRVLVRRNKVVVLVLWSWSPSSNAAQRWLWSLRLWEPNFILRSPVSWHSFSLSPFIHIETGTACDDDTRHGAVSCTQVGRRGAYRRCCGTFKYKFSPLITNFWIHYSSFSSQNFPFINRKTFHESGQNRPATRPPLRQRLCSARHAGRERSCGAEEPAEIHLNAGQRRTQTTIQRWRQKKCCSRLSWFISPAKLILATVVLPRFPAFGA